MRRQAARALFPHRVEDISPASRAVGLVIDVRMVTEQFGLRRRRRGRLLILQGPLQLNPVDVLAINRTGLPARFVECPPKTWNNHGSEQSNDCDDNHDFQQRESQSWFCAHKFGRKLGLSLWRNFDYFVGLRLLATGVLI
jgi:hypothetical protein